MRASPTAADTAPATSSTEGELFPGGPTYSPVQLFDVVEELFEEERRSKSRRRKLTLATGSESSYRMPGARKLLPESFVCDEGRLADDR